MRDGKPDRVIRALKDLGFSEDGGTKHLKMKNLATGAVAIIPKHGIIKRNTLERIRKGAGIDKKVFYGYNF